MTAYKFTFNDETFYYVRETNVKDRVVKKQGKELIDNINTTITEKHEFLPAGTVLDHDFDVIFVPDVVPSEELTGDTLKYAIADFTVVNIYEIDDRRFIGTRNSWDISNSRDLFANLSYGDAFREVLEPLNLAIETIPLGTYAFSNPKIHMMARKCRLYSFTNPEFPFDETDNDSEYIEFDGSNYSTVISPERENICRLLYTNRLRFKDNVNAISLLKCVLNYACNVDVKTSRYASKNKVFNNYFIYCRRYIHNILEDFNNHSGDEFYCVPVPEKVLKSNKKLSSATYLFWSAVLTNAYKNDNSMGKQTFTMWK